MQGTLFPAGVWGLESRARCAGFSVMEIGNRKERLRVREAGASAAGRGQRPYASFPDRQSSVTPVPIKKKQFQSRMRSILRLKRVCAEKHILKCKAA